MKISVKSMVIGVDTQPNQLTMTLQEFFVDRAHDFEQNDAKFPFAFPNDGKSVGCSILEGGCQFSFDRDPDASMLCIGCLKADCECPSSRLQGRYALQDFLPTRIYILDVDLNGTRPRDYKGGFCKYHTLTYSEEQELRAMEERLKGLPSIVFFYRTKCNGFRVGFDAHKEITSRDEYEQFALPAEECVRLVTPDRKLQGDKTRDGIWFNIDRIGGPDGKPYRSHAYWSYPRVYHPIWLNPNREIE